MNKTQRETINKLLEILHFYANNANYWSKPIPLDLYIDRKTITMVRKYFNENIILKDKGELAKKAIKEFENNFYLNNIEDTYTIEINLNDDVSKRTSYHIDTLKNTFEKNLQQTYSTNVEKPNWAFVSIAYSIKEAQEIVDKIQQRLSTIHGKIPEFIED